MSHVWLSTSKSLILYILPAVSDSVNHNPLHRETSLKSKSYMIYRWTDAKLEANFILYLFSKMIVVGLGLSPVGTWTYSLYQAYVICWTMDFKYYHNVLCHPHNIFITLSSWVYYATLVITEIQKFPSWARLAMTFISAALYHMLVWWKIFKKLHHQYQLNFPL